MPKKKTRSDCALPQRQTLDDFPIYDVKEDSANALPYQASLWSVGPSGSYFINRGKHMVTVVPLFTPSLVASMVPLLAATKALAIQKPRPRPVVTVACRLPRKNFWPSNARSSASRPAP